MGQILNVCVVALGCRVWSEDHPTWIPITVNSVMYDWISIDTGIYAITITKSQGMTIGKNQQITKAIIKLSYNINIEKICYGTAYTVFS